MQSVLYPSRLPSFLYKRLVPGTASTQNGLTMVSGEAGNTLFTNIKAWNFYAGRPACVCIGYFIMFLVYGKLRQFAL